MANEQPGGQIVPDEVYEKLLAQEDKGPIVPLEAADAKQIETGVDEQPEDVEGAEAPESKETEASEAEAPAATEEPVVEVTASKDILDKVNEVLEQVRADRQAREAEAAAPKTEAPKEEPAPVPAYIQKMLDSDDPVTREAGEGLLHRERENEARIAAIEQRVEEREKRELGELFAEHITEVSARCVPPLTDAEQNEIVARMTDESKGPALAQSLNFEDGVKLWMTDRYRPSKPATNGTPPADPAKGSEDGSRRPTVKVDGQRRETATVVDRGGTAGTPPTVRKPPDPNETLEQVVARGMRELGGAALRR